MFEMVRVNALRKFDGSTGEDDLFNWDMFNETDLTRGEIFEVSEAHWE